jgi:hypothetical protein
MQGHDMLKFFGLTMCNRECELNYIILWDNLIVIEDTAHNVKMLYKKSITK